MISFMMKTNSHEPTPGRKENERRWASGIQWAPGPPPLGLSLRKKLTPPAYFPPARRFSFVRELFWKSLEREQFGKNQELIFLKLPAGENWRVMSGAKNSLLFKLPGWIRETRV